mmetsp:Transcript_25891/g.64286  ORF Transcript_25891/g.64286 Transcript_25891/m.64286 type:complete len:223 (+) Transcript_25891:662-1330(+)
MRKTWLATCRFSPSPPALRLMSTTRREGSLLNAYSTFDRETSDMLPTSLAQLKAEPFLSRHSIRSSMAVYWEKTMAFASGSRLSIASSSCTRASILVDDLNSLTSMRLIMPRLLLLLLLVLAPPLCSALTFLTACLATASRICASSLAVSSPSSSQSSSPPLPRRLPLPLLAAPLAAEAEAEAEAAAAAAAAAGAGGSSMPSSEGLTRGVATVDCRSTVNGT